MFTALKSGFISIPALPHVELICSLQGISRCSSETASEGSHEEKDVAGAVVPAAPAACAQEQSRYQGPVYRDSGVFRGFGTRLAEQSAPVSPVSSPTSNGPFADVRTVQEAANPPVSLHINNMMRRQQCRDCSPSCTLILWMLWHATLPRCRVIPTLHGD